MKEEQIKKTFVTTVVTTEERVLTVYLMLERRQKVNYEIIEQLFGCSKRTFKRLIASVRESIGTVLDPMNTYIIYNRKRNSYELIKLSYNY